MSEHTVIENLVQRNAETTATLTCSCGLSVGGSLRRKPLRALRAELTSLHEAGREKTDRKILMDAGGSLPKPKKEKKTKKQKPAVEPVINEYGDDDFAQPVVETDSNNPEWPDEDTDKS